jgi:hypothetical protein
LVVLEFKLRAHDLSTSASPFCGGFGSHKLFAQAVFELILLLSASLVAKNTGMSH